jgi:DNA-binding NarL/FixJ family response regulator
MHAIQGEHEDVAVVMLTASSERTAILDALDAGADGYLIKDAEPEAIAAGVRSAASGHAPIDPRAARFLLEHRNRQAEPSLTQREDEVLRHVGQGLSNKAIARRLGISEKTVKSHLTRVFSELGVSDRTQAALWVRDQSKDSNRS